MAIVRPPGFTVRSVSKARPVLDATLTVTVTAWPAASAPPEEGDPFEIRPEAVRIYTRNLGRAGSVEAMVGELTFALREEALDWLGVELEDLEP